MYKGVVIVILVAFFSTVSCTRNAITGRNQLNLVSAQQLEETAVAQYKQFLSENKVVSASNDKDAEMVKRVGTRIADAITAYYNEKGLSHALDGYKWEFNLVDKNEINAWCMPGGKVVVYTGLLLVTQNEAALAIVLGHEITHAVAGHGRERISQLYLAQGIQVAGNVALGSNPNAVKLFDAVFAPSAQIGVILPNSRKQELEADHYGLIFAAMAGYNPEVAIPFWERMQKLGGAKQPVFLSDHPADEERISELKKWMPEALKYYTPIKN